MESMESMEPMTVMPDLVQALIIATSALLISPAIASAAPGSPGPGEEAEARTEWRADSDQGPAPGDGMDGMFPGPGVGSSSPHRRAGTHL